jgi:hypothetical protein
MASLRVTREVTARRECGQRIEAMVVAGYEGAECKRGGEISLWTPVAVLDCRPCPADRPRSPFSSIPRSLTAEALDV